MNVKVFTLNRNLDVVEFVVPSRVEAAEVGIDKADPKCRSHFSNQTPGSNSLRNCMSQIHKPLIG